MPQPKKMRFLSVNDKETGEIAYCLPRLLGKTLEGMGISRDEPGFDELTRNACAGWFLSADISYVRVHREELWINV